MTTTADAPTTKLVGEPVRRVEDPSLITGAATSTTSSCRE